MEADDGFLLPRLQPEISGYPTVVLIHSSIALPPVVELAHGNAQPLNESASPDLGLLRPAPDEIHYLIPHIMRHPDLGQSSPRLFFNAMCSAISSARTSSLVCTFFSKNSIRFCFSSVPSAILNGGTLSPFPAEAKQRRESTLAVMRKNGPAKGPARCKPRSWVLTWCKT